MVFAMLLAFLALLLFGVGYYTDGVSKSILDSLGMVSSVCALGALVASGAFI